MTIIYFISKQNVKKNSQVTDKCIILLIAVLVCLNIFVGVKYYSIVKDCSLKKVEERDYIASEHLRSTSLDELQ